MEKEKLLEMLSDKEKKMIVIIEKINKNYWWFFSINLFVLSISIAFVIFESFINITNNNIQLIEGGILIGVCIMTFVLLKKHKKFFSIYQKFIATIEDKCEEDSTGDTGSN